MIDLLWWWNITGIFNSTMANNYKYVSSKHSILNVASICTVRKLKCGISQIKKNLVQIPQTSKHISVKSIGYLHCQTVLVLIRKPRSSCWTLNRRNPYITMAFLFQYWTLTEQNQNTIKIILYFWKKEIQ